jgi:hypothetical protein
MRSDPMDKETVLAIIERDAIDAAAYRGYREDTMLPGERQWHADRSVAARATVEGLWEERERLERKCELLGRAVDRWVPCPDHRDKTDGQCYVCRTERAESRATRAEAALEKAELQLGCADDYAREWKAHCEAAEAALKEAGAEREATACMWAYDDTTEAWATSCDNLHLFIDGSPAENEYKFCPYCGDSIVIPTPPTVTVEAPKDGR